MLTIIFQLKGWIDVTVCLFRWIRNNDRHRGLEHSCSESSWVFLNQVLLMSCHFIIDLGKTFTCFFFPILLQSGVFQNFYKWLGLFVSLNIISNVFEEKPVVFIALHFHVHHKLWWSGFKAKGLILPHHKFKNLAVAFTILSHQKINSLRKRILVLESESAFGIHLGCIFYISILSAVMSEINSRILPAFDLEIKLIARLRKCNVGNQNKSKNEYDSHKMNFVVCKFL